MNNDLTFLTKADLRHLEFSEHLIREICKDVDSVTLEQGIKGYSRVAIETAITKKLAQTKIKPRTREVLQLALGLTPNKSNVFEVDFLQKLSLVERINFLRDRREKLREKGEEILQNVDEVLKKARAMN